MMFRFCSVIRTFADGETARFYSAGSSRRVPPEIRKRAAMRLPPSNRLERLYGDRAGQWSLRINEKWRVCFRFKNGDAFDVEIVDDH